MKQEQKQLLVFGYGLPVILFFLGLRHWHKHGTDVLGGVLLVMGICVLIISLSNQVLLKILFQYWMKGAQAIGGVVTVIILSVIFFKFI